MHVKGARNMKFQRTKPRLSIALGAIDGTDIHVDYYTAPLPASKQLRIVFCLRIGDVASGDQLTAIKASSMADTANVPSEIVRDAVLRALEGRLHDVVASLVAKAAEDDDESMEGAVVCAVLCEQHLEVCVCCVIVRAPHRAVAARMGSP